MLTGKDFIILSDAEAQLIYNALGTRRDGDTYKDLSKLGILGIVKDIEKFLFQDDRDS